MLSYLTAGNVDNQNGMRGDIPQEDWGERAKLEEERAKLDLVRRQLMAEDSEWRWSTDPAGRVAQKTWLVHPDKDRGNPDAEHMLKSTYDPSFSRAVFGQDTSLDSIRYDTKYLYPPRWYDNWTPNFLVGNTFHRLLGDSRIRNLDDKVECAQLLSQAEAHRDERNSHRRRLRLQIFLAVYAFLFAVPILVELLVPVTSSGCQVGSQTGACSIRPHSMVGWWFALIMLIMSKVATVSVDWKWWSSRYPELFHSIGEKFPSYFNSENFAPADDLDWWSEHFPAVFRPQDITYLEREWAPGVPWIGIGVSILCFVCGFSLLGISILFWSLAHIVQDFVRYLLMGQGPGAQHSARVTQALGQNTGMVQQVLEYASHSILYGGDLLLSSVQLWGPFIAGMLYVLTRVNHFLQGTMTAVQENGQYVIATEGSRHSSNDGCQLLGAEEVVPFAYAYFGAAHVALFMLGAAALSLAEFLKLKREESYLLKGWVDTDGLLSWSDGLAKTPVLEGLRLWRDKAQNRLGSLEEDLPNSASAFLKTRCGGTLQNNKSVAEALGVSSESNVLAEQRRLAAGKCLEEDMKQAFKEGLQAFPESEPGRFEKDVTNLVTSTDFDSVCWPGLVMALGFVFWMTLEGTLASPCLMAPSNGCTGAFSFAFKWSGICGTDEYILGIQTLALIFVLVIASMLVASRIASTARGITASMKVLLDMVVLFVVIFWLINASGLSNTLHDISASAMPLLPLPSSVRDFLLVVFLVEFGVLLVLGMQRLEEELEKRVPKLRTVFLGSLSTLTIFFYILGYTFAQGAFDFESSAPAGVQTKQITPIQSLADRIRVLVFRLTFVLVVLRLGALIIGKFGLMAPSPMEAKRFVERGLLSEAVGMIDSLNLQATRLAVFIPGARQSSWAQDAAWMRQCARHKVQSGLPARWRCERTWEELNRARDQEMLLGGSTSSSQWQGEDEYATQLPYDQGGYDQGGYDQGGYDQGGYDHGGQPRYDPREDPFLNQ